MTWAILYGQRFRRFLNLLPSIGLFLMCLRFSKTNVAFGYLLTSSVVSLCSASLIRRLCLPLVSSSFLARFCGFLTWSWSRLRLFENESCMRSMLLPVGIVTG